MHISAEAQANPFTGWPIFMFSHFKAVSLPFNGLPVNTCPASFERQRSLYKQLDGVQVCPPVCTACHADWDRRASCRKWLLLHLWHLSACRILVEATLHSWALCMLSFLGAFDVYDSIGQSDSKRSSSVIPCQFSILQLEASVAVKSVI